jgi:hypothetical protein
MADPVGITLGVIPLAIMICTGIIKYSSSWKTRGEDVETLEQHALRLRELLLEIDIRLQNQPAVSAVIATRLKNCISACESSINRIIEMTDNYSNLASPHTGKLERFKQHLKNLTFPFHKDTLIGLRDQLEALQNHVTLALKLLELYAFRFLQGIWLI